MPEHSVHFSLEADADLVSHSAGGYPVRCTDRYYVGPAPRNIRKVTCKRCLSLGGKYHLDGETVIDEAMTDILAQAAWLLHRPVAILRNTMDRCQEPNCIQFVRHCWVDPQGRVGLRCAAHPVVWPGEET